MVEELVEVLIKVLVEVLTDVRRASVAELIVSKEQRKGL